MTRLSVVICFHLAHPPSVTFLSLLFILVCFLPYVSTFIIICICIPTPSSPFTVSPYHNCPSSFSPSYTSSAYSSRISLLPVLLPSREACRNNDLLKYQVAMLEDKVKKGESLREELAKMQVENEVRPCTDLTCSMSHLE